MTSSSGPLYGQLVDLVYSAVEDPSTWPAVYEGIRAATGSESVHMLSFDNRHETLAYSEGANLPVQGELAYIRHFHAIDPRMALVLARPAGQWMHCHEHFDEAFVAADPFYQELLVPYDRRFATATKLVDTSEAMVIFSTLRTRQQGPMPPEGIALLEQLLPHLSRAARLGIRNFFYSTQALVGQALVSKLRQPVILMSPGGDVIHTNEAAGQLLARTGLVQVADGKLVLPEPHGRELLRRVGEIEARLKSGAAVAEYSAQFQSLHVGGEAAAGDALYAFFTVLPPGEMMGTFGLRPVVMLLFFHPESAPAIDSNLLFAVFGLTPAESRIAALLAEGLSLKEIAREQGTQHDTVRKQLRSIYQKTRTNRQPELVRLLLHLPHNVVQG